MQFVTNKTARGTEYPLWDHGAMCPTAVYVGGVSRHLCNCAEPTKCCGVRAVAMQAEEEEARRAR